MSEEQVETPVEETVTTAKRDKKLSKMIEGAKVIIEVIGGTKGAMTFDTEELTQDVQIKLIPFGASHKLGDAAAGRTGTDAEEAIMKVWEGLQKGEWTVRQAAVPKVTMGQVKDGLSKMSPEDQEKARALLAAMGITL